LVYSKGYSKEDIDSLEEQSYQKKNVDINKEGDKKSLKVKPLELYREWMRSRIESRKLEIRPDKTGLYKIYELTMDYFGKSAHMGFAVRKIKEMSDYYFYNMFDPEDTKFTETNSVTHYSYQQWKERFLDRIHDA